MNIQNETLNKLVMEFQESNAQLYSQLLDIRVRNINNINKNVIYKGT